MPKVVILYNNFYDLTRAKISVGGIQTYLRNLCDILSENGVEPYIFQFADRNFEIQIDGINVVGINVKSIGSYRRKKKKLLDYVWTIVNKDEDLLLFASESVLMPTKKIKTVCIQHGVEWDKPTDRKWGIASSCRSLCKHIGQYRRLFMMSKVDKLVCVDYNFVNWYRAAFPDLKIDYKVILNFSKLPESSRKPNGESREKTSIIFARRFFRYRGTRLFATAIKRVLEKYPDIKVTIAGEGPDEKYLKSVLGSCNEISFISYSAAESLSIHSKHDIAVVPTMGSEGSSLSLIEAMAAGCATICTDVGGMTNIVINGINGIMIRPNADDLFGTLCTLIENPNLRENIAEAGRKTVLGALSFERWKEQWVEVFADLKVIERSK